LIKEYFGKLATYSETGYEGGLALLVEDDRGWIESPGFNPVTQKWEGPPQRFMRWEWSGAVEQGCLLEVFGQDGTTVEFPKTKLRKDRKAMASINYKYFVPVEVPLETWVRWFKEERRARLWCDIIENPKP